jgi:hypothetical protein
MNARSTVGLTARRWPLLLYCLVCAVAMLVIGGADFSRLYAPSPYHRLQADALLRGQLHLADSLDQIAHDLAWHDGQVNQIWGLGVGLWLLPFEALWRLLGQKWFPDRIALGIAFALLAWYSGTAAWRLAERAKSPTLGIALVWLVTLCPALWTLNQGGRLIYEETTLYACLVSLGLLVAVVRVACFGERRDFYICAGLASLSALVRPTHGIYGLLAVLICTALVLAQSGRWRTVLIGHGIFGAGLLALALTNWSRFGSPSEFGHRLSVTPGIIVFMTRIDNPMKEASVWQASKELGGLLFWLRNVQPRGPGETLVAWQAPYERWRDPYMTTFSPAWAVIIVAALIGAARWVGRTRRTGSDWRHFLTRPGPALVLGLLAWGGLSAVALAGFYLRFPNMSSRYLLDFAPAFTGLAVVFWLAMLRRMRWLGLFALAGWLGYEILSAQVRPAPVPVLTRKQISTELPSAEGRRIVEFGGAYSITNHPSQTGIPYNGYGWDSETGLAGNIVIVAVDRPEFIEVLVGPRSDSAELPARPDEFRAMIGAEFLQFREVHQSEGPIRVRFEVPDKIKSRAGNQLLFLCFTKGFDSEDRESQRPLRSVQWRDNPLVKEMNH